MNNANTLSAWIPNIRARVPAVAATALGSLATALLSQVLLLVTGVLATRLLGPENRGHLALIVIVAAVLSLIGSLGVQDAMTYWIAKDPGSAIGIVRLMAKPIVAQVFVCGTLQVGCLWLMVRGESDSVQLVAIASVAILPALCALQYGNAILRGLQAFRPVYATRIIPLVLYIFGLIAIFVIDTDRLVAVTIAWVAVYSATAAFAVASANHAIPRCGNAEELPSRGDLYSFGIKGFLGSVSPLETFRLDQLVVGLFLSPIALGLYVASLAFTNLPRFVAASIGQVAFPYIASQTDRKVARCAMWKFFWPTVAGSTVAAATLVVTAGILVPLFFGEDFSGAVAAAQILLVGSVAFGARRILGDGMRGLGYPAANTIAEFASWGWLLLTLPLLTSRWGLEGVAIAVATSSIFGVIFLALLTLTTDGSVDEPDAAVRGELHASRG